MTLPLGVYLHFPWCVSKCPYCDFNSHALRGSLPEQGYVDALCTDLRAQVERQAAFLAGRPVSSIFLGGGTPSLFSPAAIGRVLQAVRDELPVASTAEITLEANPGTIERGRFAEYAAVGVNRVSVGAQTFDASRLRALGRVHSPTETASALAELHAAGVDNFNIDLMYGLPGQGVAEALADVQAALSFSPAQISHYHLTLEPGTPFAAQPPPALPDEDTTVEILAACLPLLQDAGFERYEISAYARRGRACAHNLLYWNFGDYLGLGAGAHGKLSGVDAATGEWRIVRTTQPRDPRRFQRDPRAGLVQTEVAPAQRPFEFMLNALRLLEGFALPQFEASTGLPSQVVWPTLECLAERGLLAIEADRLRPTPRGLQYLNDLLVEFLPSESGT
ncbi:MAG: radical SAM family heme chaperone HemW [Sinobacteraceae bacterium]|nr:radical SAM family heme chaperone HemW [Nevskiaceae bacterium]